MAVAILTFFAVCVRGITIQLTNKDKVCGCAFSVIEGCYPSEPKYLKCGFQVPFHDAIECYGSSGIKFDHDFQCQREPKNATLCNCQNNVSTVLPPIREQSPTSNRESICVTDAKVGEDKMTEFTWEVAALTASAVLNVILIAVIAYLKCCNCCSRKEQKISTISGNIIQNFNNVNDGEAVNDLYEMYNSREDADYAEITEEKF